MTEEEFKKTMTKLICFIVVALIILVVLGIIVFNQSGKTKSIFENSKQLDDYKKKVEEVNSHNITEEEASSLENSSEFQENEESDSNIEESEQLEENQNEENSENSEQ